MRKTAAITLLATASLALTGCGKDISDVTPDMPRAEKDEIYIAWAEDTYRDQLPHMTTEDAPEAILGLCVAYDAGFGELALLEVYSDADADIIPAARDLITTGLRVYCPEHVSDS